MGLAYTVDSPIKVAKYGISSVISIVDDFLIEKMNEYYSNKFKIPYQEISTKVEDYRAKRITAYLNTVDTIAKQTFSNLKKSFEEKISDAIERATISDIVSKYKDNVLGENAEFNNEGDTTFLSGDYQIDILIARLYDRLNIYNIVDTVYQKNFSTNTQNNLFVIYNTKEKYLIDLNIKTHQLILKFLQIDSKINLSSNYNSQTELEDFRDNKFKSTKNSVYDQVFSIKKGFKPNLSIIDLVFNLGPESNNYLEKIELSKIF